MHKQLLHTSYKQFTISILHFAVCLAKEVDAFMRISVTLYGGTFTPTF